MGNGVCDARAVSSSAMANLRDLVTRAMFDDGGQDQRWAWNLVLPYPGLGVSLLRRDMQGVMRWRKQSVICDEPKPCRNV